MRMSLCIQCSPGYTNDGISYIDGYTGLYAHGFGVLYAINNRTIFTSIPIPNNNSNN